MLEKTQGIRSAKDIPESEIVRSSAPKTAVGTMAAWQAAQARIRELEDRLKEVGCETMIPLDSITPNPWQPRRIFDEDDLRKLADSIAEIGLLQPILVRRVQNLDNSYQIIAGERRWRAQRMLLAEGKLGVDQIKAVVVDASDDDMIAMALAENFDRADLTAYETAVAIRNMTERTSKVDLARALGIHRSDLYRYLAFFQLPGFVLSDLNEHPELLGRDAAEAIAAVIRRFGDAAIDALSRIWTRVREKEIDQGKIALLIESSIARGDQVPVQREIRKLFIGKEQAGSITRDAAKIKIEIKAAALTPEKETELRAFVERMFQEAGV